MSESKPYRSCLGAVAFNREVSQDSSAQQALHRVSGQLTYLRRGLETATASEFDAEWQCALEQWASNSKHADANIDAELRSVGLPAVGSDPEKWEHLARVTEQEPGNRTFDEIYRAALAWIDREKLKLKLAYEFSRTHGSQVPASSPENDTRNDRTGNRQTKKNFGFPGSNLWENWGLGLSKDETWHLFHFNRLNGLWARHRHLEMTIPSGMPDGLARRFVRFGFITIEDAHRVLQKHAKAAVEEKICKPDVISRTKSPMSRLRSAIRAAVASEGHKPAGLPILPPAKHTENWRARLRFGTIFKAENGALRLKIHY